MTAWIPLMLEYALQTRGPILAVSGGELLTQCLGAVCAHQGGRMLATTEPGPSFGPWHLTGHIPELDKWNLVLVDHLNPVEYLHRFANADVLLVPNCSGYMGEIKKFAYHRQYGWLQPGTCVVSNIVNVRSGGG